MGRPGGGFGGLEGDPPDWLEALGGDTNEEEPNVE